MFRPKNETYILVSSKNKYCETHIKQTRTKPQEALEFERNKPRETFFSKKSNIFGQDSKWMIDFTG